MSWIPAFEIGVWNAWLFMCVFLLQWLVVALASNKLIQRTGHPSDMKRNKSDQRLGSAMSVAWFAATIYSIFLPFYLGTAWFYTGLAFFILGLVVLITATLNFAASPVDTPTTFGVYRYSRHPMYLSMFLVYIGVSLATVSWLFFLLTIVSVILQRLEALREENFCLEKFGDTYRNYLERTPRWIGLPKSG